MQTGRASKPRYDVERMRRHQTARGWNDTELAEQAGTSQATISRFFAGKNQSPKTAKRIAEALGRQLSIYLLRASGSETGVLGPVLREERG